MNSVVQKITLDIHKTGSQLFMSMLRGDNKRSIIFSLTEGGKPYVITNGCEAVFTAVKPDGNFIYNNCEIDYGNNTIVYDVTSQTTAVSGVVNCQIKLIGEDGGIITSPTFGIIVGETLYNEQPIVESSEEFNKLTTYVAELQQMLYKGEFKGEKGDQGEQGPKGEKGDKGDKGYPGADADVTKLAAAVVGYAKGSALAIKNSANVAPRGISIYGKSTQDGTPTPDAPIDIVSIGDDGNIEIDVFGKNLLKINKSAVGVPFSRNGITYTLNNDGGVTINGTATSTSFYNMDYENGDVKYPTQTKLVASVDGIVDGITMVVGYFGDEGVVEDSVANVRATAPSVEYQLPARAKRGRSYLMVAQGITFSNVVVYPMIRLAKSTFDTFEPYKTTQSSSVGVLGGLKAIPVTDKNLATYIDDNGQMWYADEVDFERGVYVKRCYSENVDMEFQSSNDRYTGTTSHKANAKCGTENGIIVLCKELTYNGDAGLAGTNINGVRVSSFDGVTVVARYNNKPITSVNIIYPLETPIETPLTEEEIEQYKALKMNYPNTTITNDENASMDVEYVVDTKMYIDSVVASPAAAKISSINLPSSKWQGTGNLYSQVVAIDGVTENGKIDLNPSVEQLAIFHEKDIAFVTENDDGVVTVYCIGQKPIADYTMQVTITEVISNG